MGGFRFVINGHACMPDPEEGNSEEIETEAMEDLSKTFGDDAQPFNQLLDTLN